MREIDRILEKGIINEAFLQREIRNDFEVNEIIKKLWAVQLDILTELDRICRKYKLRYWAGFGTLLGAIRHEGFIPWDDDMDIWMPREDYDRFCSMAPEELQFPIFFQTTLTDTDYYHSFARIRNSNTTGSMVSQKRKCNNGIYVDIYPLDGLADNGMIRFFTIEWIHFVNMCTNAYMYDVNPGLLPRTISRLTNLPIVKYPDLRKVYRHINKVASKVSWNDADEVGVVAFTPPYGRDRNRFARSWFDETVTARFEMMDIPVPGNYSKVLTMLYGDYMKFPPVEKRGNWHKDYVIDPDTPYKERLTNESVDS